MGLEKLNYYQILEVPPEASQEDIYSAYQKAQRTYSLSNPDLFQIFSQQEAKAWLELIDEAYSVIGSPNSRRVYDMEFRATLPHHDFIETSPPPPTPETREKPLPPGYSRTPMGEYGVSEAFEKIIQKQDVFDGPFLKKVREYKNIDLMAFSQFTCIIPRYLNAIENNNFSALPAAVFVRGYIIQYCDILGLKQEKVLPSFMTLLKNGQK